MRILQDVVGAVVLVFGALLLLALAFDPPTRVVVVVILLTVASASVCAGALLWSGRLSAGRQSAQPVGAASFTQVCSCKSDNGHWSCTGGMLVHNSDASDGRGLVTAHIATPTCTVCATPWRIDAVVRPMPDGPRLTVEVDAVDRDAVDTPRPEPQVH